MKILKKYIFVLVLLFIFSVELVCMPKNLLSDEEGFFESSIGYTLSIPFTKPLKAGHNISFDISYLSSSLWGGGCTFRFGDNFLEVTGNIQKRFDLDGNIGIPILIKFGIISTHSLNTRLGIGVESGINFYFNEKAEGGVVLEEDREYSYNFLQGLAAIFLSYSSKEAEKIIFIPAATVNIGFATTPHPVSGIYYY